MIKSGTFGTDAYFYDPKHKCKIRLNPARADYTRVEIGASPFLLNHDKSKQVGNVTEAWWDDVENVYRYQAFFPEDDEDTAKYLEKLQNGLRGWISVGAMPTQLDFMGYDQEGDKLYDAAWELQEITDGTVPVDLNAKMDEGVIIKRSYDNSEVCFIPKLNMHLIYRESNDKEDEAMPESTDAEEKEVQTTTDSMSVQRTLDEIVERQNAQATALNETNAILREMLTTREEGEGESETEAEYDVEREGDHDGINREEDEDMDREEDDDDNVERESKYTLKPAIKITNAKKRIDRSSVPASTSSTAVNREFGQVNIHPTGYGKHELVTRELNLGNLWRATQGSTDMTIKRELEWRDQYMGQGGLVETNGSMNYIPWSVLAECGPNARARAAARAANGINNDEYISRFIPQAEMVLRQMEEQGIIPQGSINRTMTTATTSAGAGTSTTVDMARSIMWLTELDTALEAITIAPGMRGFPQYFYGSNTSKPQEDWVAEGGDITKTDPGMITMTRIPKTVGMHWEISNAQLQSQDAPMSAQVEAGCEAVTRTKVMRAGFSGQNIAANFAVDTNSITGLINSGLTETGFGAALSNLDRSDLIAARKRMIDHEVEMLNLNWVMSNAFAAQAENIPVQIGGTTVYFLLADGMLDSGEQKIKAYRTVHLGKTGVTAPAILIDKTAFVLILFGAGYLFNALGIPGESRQKYDIQAFLNTVMVNPYRGEVIKVG